jgi:hypothetical protein
VRPIYVSAASLVPWSLGSGGPARALELAKAAGYAGLQVLPLRGWTPETLRQLPPEYVVAFEEAWNQGSFTGALKRHLRLAGADKPTLLDWILFGPQPMQTPDMRKLFSHAIPIVHDNEEFYEINPEGGYPHARMPVVWDTQHTRRGRRDGQPSSLGPWYELMSSVHSQIWLIHVHPTHAEISDLLAGRGTELVLMLRRLRKLVSSFIPVVIEVAPRLLASETGVVDYLARLRAATNRLLPE